jgi:putative proteasome-type protease
VRGTFRQTQLNRNKLIALTAPVGSRIFSRMTYCVAVRVDQGLVFASDSRTNAGVDHISTYGKLHTFFGDGERFFALVTAGNLATSRAVVTRLQRDIEDGAKESLATVKRLTGAADYVGRVSVEQQRKHEKGAKDKQFSTGASFILGGQIKGGPHSILLVYPEGNYIPVSKHSPFLQIGEEKYGKPILDRIISPGLSLEVAGRCALVSMDSTMRSNASVGPPIDLLLYSADSQRPGSQITFGDDDDYLRALRRGWQNSLKSAFENLPTLPLPSGSMRLVDG